MKIEREKLNKKTLKEIQQARKRIDNGEFITEEEIESLFAINNKNTCKDKSQKQVWDAIAEEWHEFKQEPAKHTQQFLAKQQGNVLDLGSGSGRHLQKIKDGKMYLVDFSEKMIELAQEKAKRKKIPAEFATASAEKLPFENSFFDAVVCNSVLHCINKKSQKAAINEIHRVLKQGGKAEISVWNKDSERFKKSAKEKMIKWRDKGERYYYLFSAEEIYRLFEKAGFKIIDKELPTRNIVFVAEKTN
jgi:ubiquinone/menaquinone biosynthesis C-methylase UbiE